MVYDTKTTDKSWEITHAGKENRVTWLNYVTQFSIASKANTVHAKLN